MVITSYLNEIKKTSDSLSVVGSPIGDSEMILYAINGLKSAFDSYLH